MKIVNQELVVDDNDKDILFLKYCKNNDLNNIIKLIKHDGVDPSLMGDLSIIVSYEHHNYDIIDYLLDYKSVVDNLSSMIFFGKKHIYDDVLLMLRSKKIKKLIDNNVQHKQ